MSRKPPFRQVHLPRLSIGVAMRLLEELQIAHTAIQASKSANKDTPALNQLIVELGQGIRKFREAPRDEDRKPAAS